MMARTLLAYSPELRMEKEREVALMVNSDTEPTLERMAGDVGMSEVITFGPSKINCGWVST